MKPLILIGGGGHCISVIEAAMSSHRDILGILDSKKNIGEKVLDFDVIGNDDTITQYADKAQFIITIGQIETSETRRKIARKIIDAGGELGTIIASTANVSRWATIGCGSVILHGAMINAGAIVGENCIVNTLANIEHNAAVGEFCHISTGAMINGDCVIGHDTFLGSQSIMLNGIEITDGCVIAAGSFIRKTIGIRGIYAGNPAKLMKER